MPPDWFSDTDPRAMRVWIEIQRRMTPAEKFAAMLSASDLAFRMQEAGTRSLYPQAGDREVFLRAASRRLGKDLARRVYGWDPDETAHV